MSRAKFTFRHSNLDRSVQPQNDFFHFAGGGWIKKHPIPKTESIWGTFYVLRDESIKRVHTILNQLTKTTIAKKEIEKKLIRNFYLSGMKTRNKQGIKPLLPVLKKIEEISNREELLQFIFDEHARGSYHLWHPFVGQDDKNAEQYIFHIAQGGLTLPDRDYYLKKDTKSVSIRKKYLGYITTLLQLVDVPATEAKQKAKQILTLETRLARYSMSRIDCSTIEKVYNKKTVGQLKKLAPQVPWQRYFQTLGVTKEVRSLLVLNPIFFKGINTLLNTVPLETWKTYLLYSELSSSASSLSKKFYDVNFSFFNTVLYGITTQDPLWKISAEKTNAYLGSAVGKEYVKKYFSPEAKKEINVLVDTIFSAFEKRIKNLDWMSAQTKKRALKKLSRITRKIGYPDKWMSYKTLKLTDNAYYENIQKINLFHHKKNIKKLGKKVDRKEWFTPPQTVNAYYDPNMNEIVFPAGILQPPFFDPHGDSAINYGAMGSVIGHELTHGFDNHGAKFDEKGNYKNWWTAKDKKAFEKKTKALVNQFNQFKIGDVHVNGTLTLGENIADLGGILIAYDAYQIYLQKHGRKNIGGFSPEQRYFMGLVTFETAHARPEYERLLAIVDTHSPAQHRVNGPLSNIEEFYQAFDVQPGDALYRSPNKRAKIW